MDTTETIRCPRLGNFSFGHTKLWSLQLHIQTLDMESATSGDCYPTALELRAEPLPTQVPSPLS